MLRLAKRRLVKSMHMAWIDKMHSQSFVIIHSELYEFTIFKFKVQLINELELSSNQSAKGGRSFGASSDGRLVSSEVGPEDSRHVSYLTQATGSRCICPTTVPDRSSRKAIFLVVSDSILGCHWLRSWAATGYGANKSPSCCKCIRSCHYTHE